MNKKVKNTLPWTNVISALKVEGIAGTFHEKELQKANQKEFKLEKVIKRKRDINSFKRILKGYINLFNSWIDKKDIV